MQKAISKYWPVFVLPTLIAFIIGFIWPFIWGIYLSFQRFTTVSKTTFVGIQNYINVFQDSTFLHAFGFTAAFTVVSTVLINVCAFAIALVLTRGIKGTNLFRTVFFMPNLIGGILLGYIWQILLNGVLANLQKPLLALDARYGFIGLVILMCWQQIGYMMIIYVAGLQSVPGDLIEAAKIDGANDREILFKIKIPMVMPSVTICTFLTLTNSFKLFDQNVALTGGDPVHNVGSLVIQDDVGRDEIAVAQLGVFRHTLQPGEQFILHHVAQHVQTVDLTGQLILQFAQLGGDLGVNGKLQIHHIVDVLFHVGGIGLHDLLQRFALDQVHGDGPAAVDDRNLMDDRHIEAGILNTGVGQRLIQRVGLGTVHLKQLDRHVAALVNVDRVARGN